MHSQRIKQKLESGSRVGIVGGGPAGSFFAMFLLRYAAASNLRLDVTIFEHRSFTSSGPRGCNRCAGVLSSRLLRHIKELDLRIPEEVIQARLASYRLHSPFGTIDISNPDPAEDIYSVYRAAGPLLRPIPPEQSFDYFLQREAVRRGARIATQKVEKFMASPRPALLTGGKTEEFDLVALAHGVKFPELEYTGTGYEAPPTHLMSQDELYIGREAVRRYLGSTVQVFLIPHSHLVFGTIVPKGDYANVSLLGATNTAPDIADFLAQDLVRKVVPFDYQRCCGCKPRAVVGPAKNPCGDGYVVIGDAACARVYKDGMGSALLTARQAALTAVNRGIAASDFRRSYMPLCRAITRDNYVGKLFFKISTRAQESPAFIRAHARGASREQQQQSRYKPFNRIIWGLFTGSYSYARILFISLNPRFLFRFAAGLIREKFTRRG
ncbi:MAG: hypothetical protein HY673_03205 [Chloroflexi bacterium]|nr:hypothetical protein [Chloroflexota bacterium]